MAAEPLYADGAVIIVDDANWDAPREATLKFAEDSRLDWTLVFDQPTASDSHPTLWNGILVLQAARLTRLRYGSRPSTPFGRGPAEDLG